MTTDFLFNLLEPSRPIAIVNVGASDTSKVESYEALVDRGIATVVGFEPQPDQFELLKIKQTERRKFLPYAVGDGQKHTLHICKYWPMSSLLKPDPIQLRQFIPFEEMGQVIQEISVLTHRLDDLPELSNMDFLQIDVQGFELAVIQNGKNRLREAVMVQAEMPFVRLYEGQALYGQTDLELQAQGFLPHCFANIKTRMIAPMLPISKGAGGIRQLQEADVVYVRNFTQSHAMSDDQLKHLALLAHYCFSSVDLAYRCIFELAERAALKKEALARYLSFAKAGNRPPSP